VRVLYTLDEVVDGKVRYTATHQLVFNADNDWTDVTLAVEGPDALDGQVNQVVRRTPGEISAGWLRGELPVSTGVGFPGDTIDRFPEQAADVQSDPLPPDEGFVPGPLMNWSRTAPPPLDPEIGLSSVELVTTDLTRDTATRLGLDARSLTEYRSDYDRGWVQQVVYQEGLPVPLTVHQVAPDGTLERMRVVELEQLSTVSLEPTVP